MAIKVVLDVLNHFFVYKKEDTKFSSGDSLTIADFCMASFYV